MTSPIEPALAAAEHDRLLSMVYSALDPMQEFREEWRELGSDHVFQLLLNSSRPNWSDYPGAFWIAPWIAQHILSCEPHGLFYIVDRWLEGSALPPGVSDDPIVENARVQHLRRLYAALNRG